MMTYRSAIAVLSGLGDTQNRLTDADVLEAVKTILSMETINATPKESLRNALRWFWQRCVEEETEE